MIEAEKQAEEKDKRDVELARCYKRMALTDDGKIIMADMARYCGQDRSSVCRQAPNPDQTMYCEGLRAAFLYMNEKINRKEKENED